MAETKPLNKAAFRLELGPPRTQNAQPSSRGWFENAFFRLRSSDGLNCRGRSGGFERPTPSPWAPSHSSG
jgi:hypothetical protein